MSDEGGLLWENHLWAFSNSDNSGGGGGGRRVSDEKFGGKLLDSSTSNSQTPSDEPVMGAVVAAGKKNGKGNKKEGKLVGESSDHEIHIWTERERRKKMRTMFSNLHALLPQLPSKADKSTIVDEAVTYIKTLQHTLQKLQKQKLERLSPLITPPKLAMDTREAYVADQISSNSNNMAHNITATNSSSSSFSIPPIFQSWCSKNLILNVSGVDAQICVCSTKKPGLLTSICCVLEKYKLEVVSAQVSSDNCKCMYMIHTHACCLNLLEVIPVEEIYRQAAREIILFVNSE